MMQSSKRKLDDENEQCEEVTSNVDGKEKSSASPQVSDKSVADFKFNSTPSLEQIRQMQADFAAERNWGQYNTPRNMLLALTGSVGDLAKMFQWSGEVQKGLPDWSDGEKEELAHGLGDILVYVVRMAESCQVDLPTAVVNKIKLNAEKFPAP